MRIPGKGARWAGGLTALLVATALAGCAGRYGAMRADVRVSQELDAGQVIAGHRYYSTGSELEPAAIVALRQDRPLRGAWRAIEATPELLRKLAAGMRGARLPSPDGAVIVDDRGKRIGVWYSYHRLPPPPRLNDDGSVEIHPPFVPSDGSDAERPGMGR